MRFVLLFSLVIVSGCGLVRSAEINKATSPTQLAAYSDQQLCNPNVRETAAVSAVKAARDLGDCTDDHLECKKLGIGTKDPGYFQCRSLLVNRALAGAAASRANPENAYRSLQMLNSGQPYTIK